MSLPLPPRQTNRAVPHLFPKTVDPHLNTVDPYLIAVDPHHNTVDPYPIPVNTYYAPIAPYATPNTKR